jgi:hypothetical protein
MEQRTIELIKTLSVQTTSYNTKKMNRFIISELSKVKDVDIYQRDGNIYVTKGVADTYPCIVSHTDTVHDIVKNFNIFKLDDKLFSIDGDTMERVGIGGDDKVGVYIALQVIKTLDVCKAAFFRDEEVGCVGSKEADMQFFDNTEFVLQCDRKGYGDFVTNIFGCQLVSDDFSLAISDTLKKFGKKESSGGLTDVYQLVQNGINVSVANMSCGYYKPHTDDEYVVISEVNKTLDLVLDIFKVCSGHVWDINDQNRYLTGQDLNEYQYSWSYNDDDELDFDKKCSCGDYLDYDDTEDALYCWTCEDYQYEQTKVMYDNSLSTNDKFNTKLWED